MEHLIIRIFEHPTESVHAEWALFSEGFKSLSSEGIVPLSDLPKRIPKARGGERRIVALVPGPQILLTTVDIPSGQRRHIRKILPFLLEEQLAEDIAQLHFAVGAQENETGRLPIAVVRKSLMQNWVQILRETGFMPQIMIPETLLIPSHPGAWSLLHDGHTIWLRTAPDNLFSMEAVMLPDMLALLVNPETPGTIPLVCYLSQAAKEDNTVQQLNQLQQQYPQLSMKVQNANPVMDIVCDGYLRHFSSAVPPLNLLQGEFQLGSGDIKSTSIWRKLTRITALWFFAMLILMGTEALYFSFKSDQMHAKSIALYQQIFPQDSKIIDPIRQMQGHLNPNTVKDGQGFLAILEKLAAHWKAKENPSVQIQNFVYRKDEHMVTLNIMAKNMETINALMQQLSGDGLSTKIVSVVSDKDNVKGQLAVKDTQK